MCAWEQESFDEEKLFWKMRQPEQPQRRGSNGSPIIPPIHTSIRSIGRESAKTITNLIAPTIYCDSNLNQWSSSHLLEETPSLLIDACSRALPAKERNEEQ